MVNVLNVHAPKFLTKMHVQNVQTQLRLLLLRVYTVSYSTKKFQDRPHKQTLGQKVWNKVFEILGHLPYLNFYHNES